MKTPPDVSAAGGKKKKKKKCEVRYLEFTIRSASQRGATCDVTARAGPVKTGRKTRQGSLGRGTLIIRDWPGSMMGNKLSVASHQRTQRHKTSRALAPTPESSPASHPGCRSECDMSDCTRGSGRWWMAGEMFPCKKMQRTSLSGAWWHCCR